MEAITADKTNDIKKTKETVKEFFLNYWVVIIAGFIFSYTRIHYLTYPLGLLHRQIVKEGYRSYEAVLSMEEFQLHWYFEQPIYVSLLELGFNLTGKSPDGMILWGRCLGFLFSIILLITLYKIAELAFGDITAKFALFLYSVGPYTIFMDIGIQRESLMFLFGSLSIFFLMKYLKTEKQSYIGLNLLFALLAFATKFTGIYFIFISMICLILYYNNSRITDKVSIRARILLLIIVLSSIALLAVIVTTTMFDTNSESAFKNTIVIKPQALIDTEFWGNLTVFAILLLPISTVLLGGISIIFSLLSQEKEKVLLVIWVVIAGMEVVFYGYGAIIHEYYIMYLLHPLIILAANTLYLLYQSNLNQIKENNGISIKFFTPFITIFFLLCSGFIPIFYFTEQVKMVSANEPLYEDIRTIGMFLNEYDSKGSEIGIVFDKNIYEDWKYHLTLTRTYIAKPGIEEFHTWDLASNLFEQRYKAIIGWSDDLDSIRHLLPSYFDNHTIFIQDILFRGIQELPSIEIWFENVNQTGTN